ncbi:MAG: serine hydrolase [Candidatus Sericytochromatia bacterium]|nr:serine hydrolase [Candidatus Sericytochromatia bacterium]
MTLQERPLTEDADLASGLTAIARDTGLEDAGLAVVLNDERRAAYHLGDTPFTAASIIKVPVMAALHAAWAEGRLRPDQSLEVTMADYTDTWKPALIPGQFVTLEELDRLMIRKSDNVATNMLLGLLGADHVAAWLAGRGLEGIEVRRKLGGTVPMPGAQPPGNRITARGIARLLHLLATDALVGPEADARMREVLLGQEDTARFRRDLAPEDRLAHKTGETSRTSHDAGILFDADGSTTLVALTAMPPLEATNRRLGAFARAARDLVRAERRRSSD